MKLNRAEKQRRKKARKAFLTFLRYLRKTCSTINKLEQWLAIQEKLGQLIDDHKAALSGEDTGIHRTQLEQIMDKTITSVEEAKETCEIVRHVLKEVVNHLAGHGLLTYLPVSIAGVAAAGIIAVYATLAAIGTVPVIIRNLGCTPIPPPRSTMTQMLELLPGVEFPREEIPSGGEAVARVPALTIAVDADETMVVVRMGGIPMQFPLPGSIRDIEFNGTPLRFIDSPIDLGDRDHNELTILCQ
jgi:hypothetical protein